MTGVTISVVNKLNWSKATSKLGNSTLCARGRKRFANGLGLRTLAVIGGMRYRRGRNVNRARSLAVEFFSVVTFIHFGVVGKCVALSLQG